MKTGLIQRQMVIDSYQNLTRLEHTAGTGEAAVANQVAHDLRRVA